MPTTHLASLLRSLATTPSRRGVARGLTGFALAGALRPLLGFTAADAKKKHKKKRRRRRKKKPPQDQPFCAGKDFCTDPAPSYLCQDGGDVHCFCFVTAGFREPYCAAEIRFVDDCLGCLAEETCVDVGLCGEEFACATPCPNPL